MWNGTKRRVEASTFPERLRITAEWFDFFENAMEMPLLHDGIIVITSVTFVLGRLNNNHSEEDRII